MYLDLTKFVLPIAVTVVAVGVSEMTSTSAVSILSASDADVMGTFTAVYFVELLLGSFTRSFKPVVLAQAEVSQ
jgi:hypothetical protein